MRILSLIAGAAVLATAWLGPLPALASHSFAAHMTIHIAVVAVAAPFLAMAIAGTVADPARAMPNVMAPIPLSMLELVVVWAWHVPAMHEAARDPAVFVLEQGSFVVAGVLLWIAAIGGDAEQRRVRAGAGVAALLFTSIHMTLLGALFALARRPLFAHTTSDEISSSLTDQELGGVIMLLVGGASYLVGGLALIALALRAPRTPSAARGEAPA
jgi:putative membrane protein